MNIRRIAVGAGLGFAFTMGALAISSAAHAADKLPAVADCPGGAVDAAARLPEKAAARAKAVVAEVAPDKPQQDEPAEEPATPPAPPAEPEPVSAPEPEPAAPTEPAAEPEPTPTEEPAPVDEPDPATDPRTTEPEPAPTEPVVDVPPVVVPPVVVETPPIAVETPPVVIGPTPTTEPAPAPEPVVLPADDPAPLPDAEAPAQATPPALPIPAPAAVPALPLQLPVLIGPLAGEATDPPAAATVGETPGAAAAVLHDAPECDRERAVHLDRDLIRQLIASLTTPDTEPAKVKATPGCPSTPKPAPEQPACTGTTTAGSSTGSNGGHMLADTTAALALPILDRIEHARARSTIPTSRHVAIEPGPA